jgi:hypothetical protein
MNSDLYELTKQEFKNLQIYTRTIYAQLEESREREIFNSAELKLLRDKLAIVVNAFEAERVRLKENCERKCFEYDIKIADEEYSHANTKMELDNALRLKNLIEAKLISVGDDLEIAEKKSEELETNLKDMHEVIQCLKIESNSLRNALENAKLLLDTAYRASSNNILAFSSAFLKEFDSIFKH